MELEVITSENIFNATIEVKAAEDVISVALRGLKITTTTTNTKFPNEKPKDLVKVSTLPIITLRDVAKHDSFSSCWIVLYDRVYDVTKFLLSHPGGEDVILDNAGRDATIAFRGTGHSEIAIKMLNQYLIGELPDNERLFRKSSSQTSAKFVLSNVPE